MTLTMRGGLEAPRKRRLQELLQVPGPQGLIQNGQSQEEAVRPESKAWRAAKRILTSKQEARKS